MLIVHFIGLAMGLGTSFGFMFLGISASKLEPEEQIKFSTRVLALSRMGHIGIVLLVLSGGYLMTPYLNQFSAYPLFTVKLVLVVVLIILVTVATLKGNRIKNGEVDQLNKVRPIGSLAMLTSVIIVILAVLSFH